MFQKTEQQSQFFSIFRIVILGLLSLGFWYNLFALGNLRNHTGLFVSIFFALFLLYCLSFWKLNLKKWGLVVALGFAVLFRIIVFATYPTQSNDVYRYLWDGHVMHHSENPYLYPPSATELAPLRSADFYPHVGFVNLNTIYPPVAQGVFWLGYALTPESVVGIKLLVVLFDLGIIGLLLWLLHLLKKPLNRVLIYAWHPLVIFEYASSGHNDAFMVFFLVLACILLVKQMPVKSWIAMGLAIGSKIAPLFVVPWFFKHLKWWSIVVLPLVGALVILPFISAGDYIVLEGMKQYGGVHEFNSSLYAVFQMLFPESDVIRTVLSMIFLGGVVLMFFLYRKNTFERFMRGIIWTFGMYFLFASNVHPWYLLWIIPFFTVSFSPTWFYFSGIVILSYFHYQDFIHVPNYFVTVIQYLPLYCIMFFELGYHFAKNQEAIGHFFMRKPKHVSKTFKFRLLPE